MKKSKKFLAILTSAALAVSLAACGSASDLTAAGAAAAAETESESPDASEIKETKPSVTAADADTVITFSDTGTDIDGQGVSAEDNVVTISESGKYALSGNTASGRVVVDAGDDDTVTLILDNVDITCEDDAAIYIENAKLVEVILADESKNRVQSGAVRDIDISAKNTDSEDASGGALQAKSDLTLTGNGSLEVLGYINNGVQSSDNLIIDSGEIEISAVHHALKGETVTVNDGDITLTAMQDGIHTDDAITITGGSISIATGDDAIHSDNDLTIEDGVVNITDSYEGIEGINILISGGEINLVSTDDGINASDGSGSGFGPMGGFDLPDGFDPSEIMAYVQENGSLEGYEFPEEFELPEGSEFPGNRTDMSEGAGFDGPMPGGFGGRGGMERGDGQMPENFEGREDMDRGDMPERGGFGGRGDMDRGDMPEDGDFGSRGDRGDMPDSGDFDGRGGMERGDGQMPGFANSQSSPEDLPTLRITGGNITVSAQGDGIDSNGNIYIEGGVTIVNGPTGSGNGALDYGSENGGECLISGGTVLAVGSSGMAETFGGDSSQCSFLINLDSSFDEGDTLTITAEDGTVLFEYDIVKRGSSVVFSSPDLSVGDTVTVTVGDQSSEVTLDSVSTRIGGRGFGMGGFGGGFGDREGMPGGGFGGRGVEN